MSFQPRGGRHRQSPVASQPEQFVELQAGERERHWLNKLKKKKLKGRQHLRTASKLSSDVYMHRHSRGHAHVYN